MSSRKSNVWHFFYKTNKTTAACTLCGKNYSRKGRGTTCLRNHLRSLHPVEFMTLSEKDIKYVVKREAMDSAPKLSQNSTNQLQLEIQESEADPLEAVECPLNNALCDEKLAMMLVNYSFNMIESHGFINFIRVLQPKYFLQGKSYYENLLCHHIYPKMKAQIISKLDLLDSYTLVFGIYKNKEEGLMILTCSGISSDFQPIKLMLKCKVFNNSEGPDKDLLKQLVDNNWWILNQEKIHCVLRDESTRLGANLIDCNVQCLKLCSTNAFYSNEPLQQLAGKCREIINQLDNHQAARDHLGYIQENRLQREPLPIFENCDNDWNSIYRKMAHLYKMKDALTIYGKEYNTLVQIYPDEWLEIDLCTKVMQPLEEVIKIWSDCSTSASSVIPLVSALRDSLQTDIHTYVSSVTICAFARKLLEELDNKFAHLCTDMKYLMATYLDPRYKQAFFTAQQEQMVIDEALKQLSQTENINFQDQQIAQKVLKLEANSKHESKIDVILNNILTSTSTNNNQEATLQSQLKNLLYLYNSDPRIERNANPLVWWQRNIKFNLIYGLVRRYLSTPAATSPECQKLFKSSEHLYGDIETGLSTANASKILFIKSNLNILYSDGDLHI